MKKKKTILFLVILIFFVAVFLIYFFISHKTENLVKQERTELQKLHPELKIEDLVIGQGERAERGKKLTVHYVGKFPDGTVFDSTYEKGKTFSFVLGQGRVIQGWEIGIEGMREGGKRRLTIPPQLGYGESGVRGIIPPNVTLIFEIELIKVE